MPFPQPLQDILSHFDQIPPDGVQLLASPFYEAVKREIGRTPACEAEKRRALAAAADQCRRAADCTVAPANIVVELRAAVATLSSERTPSLEAPPGVRPQLRLIQGELA